MKHLRCAFRWKLNGKNLCLRAAKTVCNALQMDDRRFANWVFQFQNEFELIMLIQCIKFSFGILLCSWSFWSLSNSICFESVFIDIFDIFYRMVMSIPVARMHIVNWNNRCDLRLNMDLSPWVDLFGNLNARARSIHCWNCLWSSFHNI